MQCVSYICREIAFFEIARRTILIRLILSKTFYKYYLYAFYRCSLDKLSDGNICTYLPSFGQYFGLLVGISTLIASVM
jgi:hypothetical protein